jgi:hypothetical protein
MNAVFAGTCVAALTLAGGIGGLILHRTLPHKITSGALRDMTGAVSGLLTLLTALVLGLLIWTAYGVYSSQVVAVRSLATQILQLDLALADFGPDAASGRARLREDVMGTVDRIWGAGRDKDFVAHSYGQTIHNLHERQTYLNSLQPTGEAQKQALAAAVQAAAAIAQTRLQMTVALTDAISRPLVIIVIAWAVCIFIGFGLMHTSDLAAVAAMAVGAIAVSTAVYLIIDLSEPYSGVFQVSSDPIRGVLQQMERLK